MTEQKTPTNTTKALRDPAVALGVALGGPDAIPDMEARGQREMVNATVLPVDMGWKREGEPEPQEQFEALGFTFGDVVEGDPLFREATLPEGWTRDGTEHSMWSIIRDERGIERVSIFYKAAFYDRKAHMSISRVGAQVAQRYIYSDSDDPFVLPDNLTPEEVEQVRAHAQAHVEEAKEFPTIYGETRPRAEEILAALSEKEDR